TTAHLKKNLDMNSNMKHHFLGPSFTHNICLRLDPGSIEPNYPFFIQVTQCCAMQEILHLNDFPPFVSWALVGPNLILWHNLVARLIHVQLQADKDIFKWDLNSSRCFTGHGADKGQFSKTQLAGSVRHLWELVVGDGFKD
ncbi:hypothetical protein ACJX0J_017649, partial [Zea mays]